MLTWSLLIDFWEKSFQILYPFVPSMSQSLGEFQLMIMASVIILLMILESQIKGHMQHTFQSKYAALSLGSLVRYWTMRYKAKHQYFKSLATQMGNFINVTFSLAMRQQSNQCCVLYSDSGFCFKVKAQGKVPLVFAIDSFMYHCCTRECITVQVKISFHFIP